MKIQNLVLLTLTMASSACVWAGDLHFKGKESSNGQWEPHPEFIAAGEDYDIALESESGTVAGSLKYYINEDPNTYFTINVNGRNCNVNGQEQVTLALGTKDYTITAKSESKCEVSVTSKDNGANPGLNLELKQDLIFHCNDDSDANLNVKVKQALPYTIGDRHFLFVFVNESSGSCGNNSTDNLYGIHTFERDAHGDFIWSDALRVNPQLDSQEKNTMVAFSVPKLTEADPDNPEEEVMTHHVILTDMCNSEFWHYTWNEEIGKFEAKTPFLYSEECSPRTANVVTTEKGTFMIVAHEGNHGLGYKQFATIHEWNGSSFNEEPLKDLAGGDAEYATTMGAQSILHFKGLNEYDDVEDYVIFANSRNEIGTHVNLEVNAFKVTAKEGGQFPLTQADYSQVETFGIKEWESFTVGSETFLLPINTKAETYHYPTDKAPSFTYNLFKWEKNKLSRVEGRSYPVSNEFKDWKHLELEGYHYFLAARGKDKDGLIWAWDGVGIVDTNGSVSDLKDNTSTLSWETMKIGDQTYVFRLDDSGNSHVAVQVYVPTLVK